MKNILFISYDGMTDPLGQSQVIPYLAGLTKYGFRFTILSCEKHEKFALYKEDIEKSLENLPVKWVPIPYHKKPPVISAWYDLYILKKTAGRLHIREPFDLVHTRAGTPAMVGLWMKKKFGVKFLNDLRDFFADSRVDSGSWNLKNPVFRKIYQYFKIKESRALRENDGIVCLTHAAEKIICQLPEYKKNIPLQVIPCSVDLELFDPKNISLEIKKKISLDLNLTKNDIIFSYLGSVGGWYLTDEMMAFYRIISEKIPEAKFLFITPHQHEIIFEKASKHGISKAKILVKHATRKQVPAYLSLSKFSIFFIKPCYSKQASSPTKHGEIMAMGIPLITNEGVGDVAEIVNQYHSGIILTALKEKDFLQTARLIRQGTSFDPEKIREGARQYYDLKKAVLKYKELYDSILSF